MPDGPVMAKLPRLLRVPPGRAWVAFESPRGQYGAYGIATARISPSGCASMTQLLQPADRRLRARTLIADDGHHVHLDPSWEASTSDQGSPRWHAQA
jgi:hypothetical protein